MPVVRQAHHLRLAALTRSDGRPGRQGTRRLARPRRRHRRHLHHHQRRRLRHPPDHADHRPAPSGDPQHRRCRHAAGGDPTTRRGLGPDGASAGQPGPLVRPPGLRRRLRVGLHGPDPRDPPGPGLGRRGRERDRDPPGHSRSPRCSRTSGGCASPARSTTARSPSRSRATCSSRSPAPATRRCCWPGPIAAARLRLVLPLLPRPGPDAGTGRVALRDHAPGGRVGRTIPPRAVARCRPTGGTRRSTS